MPPRFKIAGRIEKIHKNTKTPTPIHSKILKFFDRICPECKRTHTGNEKWCSKCQGFVFRMGKHQGKSFRWVLRNAPDYTYWLVQHNTDTAFESFRDWFKEDPANLESFERYHQTTDGSARVKQIDDGELAKNSAATATSVYESTLTDGKYGNRTYVWVHDHDASYCNFILRADNLGQNLRAFQQWLKRQYA